ncbi:aldo/keto reductase [Flavobacterium psychrotrophum]|uniref:aldo/keto reductase n=1 Tax=Flavobacterium psychrotrophum TaxID=2294119 RepID=UPI000E31508C|nr:aldo/keto reductase [Flavobacterium psychrotrophum]
MKKINLGQTDLQIAPLNFGGNVFGWTLSEKESFDILDAFAGEGFNFIDTADTYSWWVPGHKGGESEAIIGKWLKARSNRADIVVATKVGSQTNEHKEDISRAHILKSVDESLQRLGTDHIDLYYTHFDDNKTPIEETLRAYEDIVKAGKVRYIGASNVSPERLTESLEFSEANGIPAYKVLQPHYNLVERTTFENDYAPIADKYGLAVLPYWSLAAGFLTGKYRTDADLSKSVRGGGVKQYLNDKGLGVLNALDTVAQKHNTKPATVSLAWLLAQPLVAAPIVSATSQSQLDTLFAAPKLQLDAEDLQLLDEVSK